MALPTASDNPFPSLLVTETAAASISSPAAGKQRLFVDTDHVLKYKNSGGTVSNVSSGSGNVATDAIWDAAGDIALGTGADTAARLAIGASAKVLGSNGTTASWVYPPGYEIGYDQVTTSSVTVSSTTESSGTTILTASAYTFDGAAVMAEFFSPDVAVGDVLIVSLFEGATQIGRIAEFRTNTSGISLVGRLRFTPTAASHTYKITGHRASSNAVLNQGAGGTGTEVPMFLRFTKV